MNREKLKEEIIEMRDRAQKDLEESTRIAGMNAYGTGVEWGAVDAFNRVLELL